MDTSNPHPDEEELTRRYKFLVEPKILDDSAQGTSANEDPAATYTSEKAGMVEKTYDGKDPLALESVQRRQELNNTKKDIRERIFSIIRNWSIFICFVIFMQGSNNLDNIVIDVLGYQITSPIKGLTFKLETTTLSVLLGTTTANFLALVYVILRHYFHKQDSKEQAQEKDKI